MHGPQVVSLEKRSGIEATESSYSSVSNVKLEGASAEDIEDVKRALGALAHALFLRLPKTKSRTLGAASVAGLVGTLFLGLSEKDQKVTLHTLSLEKMPSRQFLRALATIVQEQASRVTSVANALALSVGCSRNFEEAYRGVVAGELFSIERDGESAINGWTPPQTAPLVEDGELKECAAIFLHVLHLQPEWVAKFSEIQIKKFTCSDLNQLKTPFVCHKNVAGGYYADEETEAIELPYMNPSGHKLSFMACRPKVRKDLSEYLPVCTPEALLKIQKAMKRTNLSFSMPELQIDTRVENLKELLEDLGLPAGALPQIDPRAELSKVIQKVKFKVDKGSAPRLVTAPLEPHQITFDRPYAYFVLDWDTPIVQGTVEEPSVLNPNQ